MDGDNYAVLAFWTESFFYRKNIMMKYVQVIQARYVIDERPLPFMYHSDPHSYAIVLFSCRRPNRSGLASRQLEVRSLFLLAGGSEFCGGYSDPQI